MWCQQFKKMRKEIIYPAQFDFRHALQILRIQEQTKSEYLPTQYEL